VSGVGLQIPGELNSLLRFIGFEFPDCDETKLYQMGQVCTSFGRTLEQISSQADNVASQVWSQNSGQDIQAFQNSWSGQDGPSKVIKDAAQALQLMGTGMSIIAAIMLALKMAKIQQMITLALQIASAIARAPATFGASLAEIPIYQQISQRIVQMLVNQVLSKLQNA
jgi:hypothetical protein